MGMIARVLNFANTVVRTAKYSVVTVEGNTGDNRLAEFFQTSGDDSPPLNDDNVAVVALQRQGGLQAVGVIDHRNDGVSKQGEKRIYSRDSSGAVSAELHLKNDGSLVVKNTAGAYQISISASGAAVVDLASSLTLNPSDTIINSNTTINGDLLVDGGVTWTGSAQGSGGPAKFVGGLENTGGDIVSDGVSLEQHTHGGVVSGADDTGPPN